MSTRGPTVESYGGSGYPVKFLVDAKLPPALAQWLREHGHQAQHVEDLDLRHAEDQEIWMHALNLSTVLITKDQDFAERAARDPDAPRIVWLRVGNTTNPALVQWLAPKLQNVIALLERGDALIEVR